MNIRMFLLIVALCFPMISRADVIFLAKGLPTSAIGPSYTLEISYQICNTKSGTYEVSCGETNVVKMNSFEKNYIKFATPEMKDEDVRQDIIVSAAILKTTTGSISAQGSYPWGEVLGINDSEGLKYRNSWVFNFDILQDAGIISMYPAQYAYNGPTQTKVGLPRVSDNLK